MGNFRCRRDGFLPGWQINVAEMMFRGFTDERIIDELWPDTPKEKREGKRKVIRRLKKDEKFQEYYKSLVIEWSVHNVGKALNKLSEQVDSDKPWIANKAANDVLLHSKQFISDGEDKTVVVRFDSGIDLGEPEVE
ncbi:MAG: hypothetical protein J6X83_00080 [Methanomicrobium sp.]|nr:hypothetical protein [Methanomicrobium sp.]